MSGRRAYAEKTAAVLGIATGFATVAFVVLTSLIPAGTTLPPAQVTVRTGPTGTIGLEGDATFLEAGALRAGDDAEGVVMLRSQTGRPMDVRMRAVVDSADLDALLRVEVRAGDRAVFQGTLGLLQRWTEPFGLDPGARAPLRVRVGLPADTAGSEARKVAFRLELEGAPRV